MEAFLQAERAQLPPWAVVGFGAGIAAWFALDLQVQWVAFVATVADMVGQHPWATTGAK